MKKLTAVFTTGLMLVLIGISSNCLGNNALSSKIWRWNKRAVGNKYINNVIFWVLAAIQVYSISLFIDVVVLNTIQFWTGSNPLAMAPGETETQIVKYEGKKYQLTASQNRMEFLALEEPTAGQPKHFVMQFEPETKTWFEIRDGKKHRKLIEFETTKQALIYNKQGETKTMNFAQSM